ncbi:MAG: hypothetical protein EOO07_18795 [Chitinophagaceae bacterium]|nr:MAG: hypothetical protein EOO07_18795 [Chitinophagaceae bacterium]
METNDKNLGQPVIYDSPEVGEKIIFDIVIKEKLAHIIVRRDTQIYYINVDGEDLGSFTKDDDGNIERFGQPRGAADDFEDYFKPIEAKLAEMGK